MPRGLTIWLLLCCLLTGCAVGPDYQRVDTRVMQVVYSFFRTALAVYPGQLMDVYIEDRSGPAVPKTNPVADKGKP